MELKVRLMRGEEVESALLSSGTVPAEYGIEYKDGYLYIHKPDCDWFVQGTNSLGMVDSLVPCTRHGSFDNVVLGYFVSAGIVTVE